MAERTTVDDEVRVYAVRRDSPPKIVPSTTPHRRYRREEHRLELLQKNVRKYGTISDTMAAAAKLQGRDLEEGMSRLHAENHLVSRIGWLRAALLGANDGIVSTASLIVGVASAAAGTSEVLVAEIAGLVAGAMSMAAGEYVSVSSQSDTENADLKRERWNLKPSLNSNGRNSRRSM